MTAPISTLSACLAINLKEELCAGYTYWKQRYRTENRGWRLDYALVIISQTSVPCLEGQRTPEQPSSGSQLTAKLAVLNLQVSDGLVGNVYETFHRPDVMGSDHCPIGITLLHA